MCIQLREKIFCRIENIAYICSPERGSSFKKINLKCGRMAKCKASRFGMKERTLLRD